MMLILTVNFTAENAEDTTYFGIFNIPQKVTANLTPLSRSKVRVQFERFTIGFLQFNAPSRFRGELDITYVDEDFRLSRGDKGNLFILTKSVKK